MATVNLGKIKLKWRGTYAGGTAYTPDDVVAYTDGSVTSSYICVTASTGNAPSSGGSVHSSWNYLAKGQNATPTTTQGDIIVRGASADQRLAIGTAGQVLKVNSSANGLEYGLGAKILQVVSESKLDKTSFTSSGGNYTNTGIQATITPIAASSKILVMCAASVAANSGYRHSVRIERSINGASFVVPTGFVGNADGNQTRSTMSMGNPSTNAHIETNTMNILDTPSYSVGNAIIYRLYGNAESNGQFFVNRSNANGDDSNYSSPMSTMTLIEVAA